MRHGDRTSTHSRIVFRLKWACRPCPRRGMRINVYDGGRPVHGPSKVYLPVRAAFPLGLITGWSLIDRRAEERKRPVFSTLLTR